MKSDFCPATKADSAIKGNCVCSAANTATDASLANAIPGVNTDNALDNAPAMQVNIAKTRQYYLSLRQEDLCDCTYCCCYCNQVRTAYPNLAAWLDSLGIAIEKPFEASALEPDENGFLEYGVCQYVVFGSCPDDYRYEIDEVQLRRSLSHPATGIVEQHFVLDIFSVRLPHASL